MCLRLVILYFLLCLSAFARGEVLIIVNADNPVDQLTQKQTVDLFMGRVRSFAGNQPAQTLDLVSGAPVRAPFYRALTGKSEAQIDAYWATLIFAGKMPPPRQFATEREVISEVAGNPRAIGYVSDRYDLPPSVKAVLRLSADI